jgi:signal transduction histidine kinase
MPDTQDNAPVSAAGSRGLSFRIGMWFLVVNIPLGYLAVLGGAAMAAASDRPAFWMTSGAVLYAISWLMLGAGVLLAGREGLAIVRDYRRRAAARVRSSRLFRFSLTSRGARYQFAMGIALVSVIPALGIVCIAVRGFFSQDCLAEASHLVILGLVLLSAVAGYVVLRRHAENISAIRKHLDHVIEHPGDRPVFGAASDNDVEAILECMAVLQEKLRRQSSGAARPGPNAGARERMEGEATMAVAISHDLNNVMAAILAHAGAIRKLLREGPAHDHARAIESNAGRVVELANQMLMCTGRSICRFDPIDINAVVSAVVSGNQESGTPAAIRFVPGADMPTVYGDNAQLRRAMASLLENAVESISESGAIDITTGVRHCDASCLEDTWTDRPLPPGPYIFVRVADTGAGIPGNIMQRIFDPFFTTKLRRQGLGLPIALGIVHMHNGTIDVQSEPGRGSVFTVLLPTTKPDGTIL